MGSIVVAKAAALAPSKVSSLTLIEPPAYANAMDIPIVAKSAEALRVHWDTADRGDIMKFLQGFIKAMEMDLQIPSPLPPGMDAAAKNLLTERPWLTGVPMEALQKTSFPKLVVSGTSSPVFEAICDRLAQALKASRHTYPKAGHAAQRVGEPFNKLLEAFMQGNPV